jgi:hypothetical protein
VASRTRLTHRTIQALGENRDKADQTEAALKAESYAFKINPVSVHAAENAQGREGGGGAADSFQLSQKVARVFGNETLGHRMALGLLLGAALFIAVAVLGERNALWIPGVVLIVAAVASLLA